MPFVEEVFSQPDQSAVRPQRSLLAGRKLRPHGPQPRAIRALRALHRREPQESPFTPRRIPTLASPKAAGTLRGSWLSGTKTALYRGYGTRSVPTTFRLSPEPTRNSLTHHCRT